MRAHLMLLALLLPACEKNAASTGAGGAKAEVDRQPGSPQGASKDAKGQGAGSGSPTDQGKTKQGDGKSAPIEVFYPDGKPRDVNPPDTEPTLPTFAHDDQDGAFHSLHSIDVYLSHITIVARDPETGDIGYAMLSSAPSAGSMIGGARAELGAVIIGGRADGSGTVRAFEMLQRGDSAEAVVDQLAGDDPNHPRIAQRQIAVIDAKGGAAFRWGEKTRGQVSGNYCVKGNGFVVLTSGTHPNVVTEAMTANWRKTAGFPLPERLLLAVQAGQETDPGSALQNEAAPRSGALVVVRPDGGYAGTSDRFVDVRVDLSLDPLTRLLNCYSAWVRAHLSVRLRTMQRAIDDTSSPRYRALSSWLNRIRRGKALGEK